MGKAADMAHVPKSQSVIPPRHCRQLVLLNSKATALVKCLKCLKGLVLRLVTKGKICLSIVLYKTMLQYSIVQVNLLHLLRISYRLSLFCLNAKRFISLAPPPPTK